MMDDDVFAESELDLDDRWQSLLAADVDPVEAGMTLQQMAAWATQHPANMLGGMVSHAHEFPAADHAVLAALLRIMHNTVLNQSAHSDAAESLLHLVPADSLGHIIDHLPLDIANGYLPLHLLAKKADSESIELLVDRLSERPPQGWMEAGQVLSPLMQSDDWPPESFFPAALDLLAAPSLASPVLDLASYVHRTRGTASHPAASRLQMLNHLLGEVTMRLSRFEEDPRSLGDDVKIVGERLGAAVALAVSLCDNLGLIGDESSIGKLNQTLKLRHRRVQCEAAGALARMGQPNGRETLVTLSADPAARLRAIAYADELGFGGKIDPQYRTEESVAESEMALWLSGPAQMGVPPTGIETVHSRQLSWPGYESPVEVYLVRFEYNFGQSIYSNVGITGPVVYALSTDVADLPHDDIYAIYAGWHVEHNDIFAVPLESMNAAQKQAAAVLAEHLKREGYTNIQPQLLGIFLDEAAAVFSATGRPNDESSLGGAELLVITDGLETIDSPIAGRLRPMQPNDIFNLYKGRKILRTFNPQLGTPDF